MKKLFLLFCLFIPGFATAGNDLDSLCATAKYSMVKGHYIEGLVTTTMWQDKTGSPAMNIKINGNWYGIYLDNTLDTPSSNGQAMFELANINYTLGKKVDVCVSNGYIFGLSSNE